MTQTMTIEAVRVLRAEGPDSLRYNVSIPEKGDGNPAIDLRQCSRLQATEAIRTLYHGITARDIVKLADEVGSVTVPA